MSTKNVTIVTTTINSPTIATRKFAEIAASRPNFTFVICGDTKTPHEEYRALEVEFGFRNVIYLDPSDQDRLYPEVSRILGWKTIERRNLGFMYAYDNGADVLATVDDDNIPYSFWGDNIFVGEEVEFDNYRSLNSNYFDPLAVTNTPHLWHRGYPIEHLQTRHNVEYLGLSKKKCLIQAMLWDGDPDIDAICRLTFKPEVKYDVARPYGSSQKSPFNSQNTFIAREAIPHYAMLPALGRMDDIWASYIFEHYFPNTVVYDVATVYQDRNVQDLVTNLEAEVIGYRNTLNLAESGGDYRQFLPQQALDFWDAYRSHFKSNR